MRLKLRALALVVCVGAAGCVGEAELLPGPRSRPGVCAEPAEARVRRLTRGEFDASAAAALGISVTEGASLASEDRVLGFTTHDGLQVSALFADQLDAVTQQLAQRAGAQLAQVAPCGPGEPELSCAHRFIDRFGAAAYRRPLADEERADLRALYDAGREGADYRTGVELVVQGVLQSASFLYRTELGAGTAPGLTQLTPHEVASQLSYLVTSAPPDEALRAAAEAGLLTSPDERERQARRLLATPLAHAQLQQFVVEWLGLQNVSALQKDNNVFPYFSVELKTSMKAESDAFLAHVLSAERARLSDLLAADYTFVDSRLAEFYGLPDRPGDLPARVSLPRERAGILTHAGLLATYSHANDSSPILRGKLVRTRLLCQPLPAPPAEVIVAPPVLDDTRTTRQRVADHTASPSCSGCHSLMDPIGFGMEDFDGMGQHRTEEHGLPVDASGTLAMTADSANEGPFTGGAALARMLANSSEVAACASTQLFRYAMGRKETKADACQLERALARFRDNELDLRELVIELVRADPFTSRRVSQ